MVINQEDPTKYKDVINAIVKAEGYWLEVSTHYSWDENVARIQYVWKKTK